MVQLEELESQFIDFDQFTEQLGVKREEIYDSFQGRKQQLLDDRQRQANALDRSGQRIISSITKRLHSFDDTDELNAYLASDPMVQKLRSLIEQLAELGDTVKADELAGALKSAREDAIRQLRDRTELFDGDAIAFGKHRFSVNRQELDLSMLRRDDEMVFHLAGTSYYAPIDDPAFTATRAYWDQDLVSENDAVYRAEYLAWQLITASERGDEGLSNQQLLQADLGHDDLLQTIRGFAAQRYEEQYERGLHDHDAAKICSALLHLRSTCGLLRYPAAARAAALLWWQEVPEQSKRDEIIAQAQSYHRLAEVFGPSAKARRYATQLDQQINAWWATVTPDAQAIASGGVYLMAELASEHAASKQWSPIRSGEAADLITAFHQHLAQQHVSDQLTKDLAAVQHDVAARWQLAAAWIDGFLQNRGQSNEKADHPLREECIVDLLLDPELKREDMHARAGMTVEGLLGQHPRISEQRCDIRIDSFFARLDHFALVTVPGWQSYQQLRREVIHHERERLRLEEFKPRVLTSFVRNKLINQVYLPLIGDNFAKQIGTAGADKRTDLMGMLLLISPPGYGKTTLMEYVSSILGLTFMKINGPAIGHNVLSLDPAEAPNATARQELEKLNLSLEMGNNVLLYLDDIQHCNPEFLQKFISLCDGQRRIEGVWRGKTRTYDLRGRKFAVVMAGNPYTESGDTFQIPDMLANRADTYNLGDILGGHQHAFELSYLENCLTSNAVLAPLASRSQQDIYRLIAIADGDDAKRSDLEHGYSTVELDEICQLLRHLRRIQAIVLQVNQCYIQSAATADDYRVEPPFKLQGSYRNMAKLAEKTVAIMEEAEVDALLLDHYTSESQTLTNAAEANLLKFKQLLGVATEQDQERWSSITEIYRRKQEMSGAEDDPLQLAIRQLIRLNDEVGGLGKSLGKSLGSNLSSPLTKLSQSLDQTLSRPQPAPQVNVNIDELTAAVRDLGTNGASEVSEPKVEIVNTIPKYYGRLYQHHVDVLEHTLGPALNAVSQHLSQGDEVRQHLRELVQELKQRQSQASSAETLDTDD